MMQNGCAVDPLIRIEEVRSEILGEVKDLRSEVLAEVKAHGEILKSIKSELRQSTDRTMLIFDKFEKRMDIQTDYQIKLEKNIIENNYKIDAHDKCIQSIKSNSRWAFRAAIGSLTGVIGAGFKKILF